MAQESCNLDKDEGEILKPTSPPPNPSLLFLKPCQGSPVPRADAAKPPAESSWPSKKLEKKSGPLDRCTSCRRRVGLTGFRCRCGDLFCPRHRYSETHDCSFDYKVVGREEISKANPLVRPAKIIKI